MHWINPYSKVLIIIRSQFTIIKSYYYLYLKKGGTLSFGAYLKIIVENKKFDYWTLYNSYKRFFGKNIKIILFEDLIKNKQIFINEISDWLGMKKLVNTHSDQAVNQTPQSADLINLRLLNKLIGFSKFSRGHGVNPSKSFN